MNNCLSIFSVIEPQLRQFCYDFYFTGADTDYVFNNASMLATEKVWHSLEGKQRKAMNFN